jgi:hypothetical protein
LNRARARAATHRRTKMMVSQNINGLKLGDKITAPVPFNFPDSKGPIVTAEIMGFRYYTSRNTGRSCIVADYIMNDGKVSFDPVEKLVPLKLS